ncbi:hypothetical protein GZH49_12130 [Nocardia terpenica]|uniref:hypothetical protein n=1 Tax=Nocardia terpenica TaxID=455432 RepID=UPI002FE2C9C2
MTRYDCGSHVNADNLRVGDQFGEEIITRIDEFTDEADDYVEAIRVVMLGGATLDAAWNATLAVPHHHWIDLVIEMSGPLTITLTCLAPPGARCRQLCGRCGHTAAWCGCSDGQPTHDGGFCQWTRSGEPADEILARYSGPAAPLRSGPVMLWPAHPGPTWEYADPPGSRS